jgi:hypothetical protein
MSLINRVPVNFQIQKNTNAIQFNPELISVTSGAYLGTAGNVYQHNPSPYPAGIVVTSTYKTIEITGKTALLQSPPATSPVINVETIGHIRSQDTLAIIFCTISFNRVATPPTGGGATDELRIRVLNPITNTTTYSTSLPGLINSNWQQTPKLTASLQNKNGTNISLGAVKLQARLLVDGTIALTKVTYASGDETALTYSDFNSACFNGENTNDVAILTVQGRVMSGVI